MWNPSRPFDYNGSPDMQQRFNGPDSRPLLIEALRIQPIVGGDASLAEALADSAEVASFPTGSSIVKQAAPDNDLHFILAGTVSIRVSGRQVTALAAGQHFGEMAILDPGKPRSASVVADEETVTARIPAGAFAYLADDTPQLWKNVARTLADHISQHNRSVAPMNPHPVLFIGCSAEALPIGRAIESALEHDPIEVHIWDDDVFKASQYPLESLELELPKVDFAVLVLSPDDQVTSRNRTSEAPRDNLVFELGMFMGALGRSRTFLIRPDGTAIKLPTDLAALTALRYQSDAQVTNSADVSSICEQLRSTIMELGPR